METMRVSELLAALEDFRTHLIEHRQLWGQSLSQPVPSFPVKNQDNLQAQSDWLTRRLGSLRPYIERFEPEWRMVHQATRATWDSLEAATGLTAVAQVKGPSLGNVIERLNGIAGRLEVLNPEDLVAADAKIPLKSGLGPDQLMLAYLHHLHPYIAKGCSRLFVDGHYPQAVEECAKAVFEYLRGVTGLRLDGAPLAQQSFSLKNPILAFSDLSDESKRNEQLGFMEMLTAFAKGVRNPLAHTHGRLEEQQKAFEYLCLASLFCRRIDDASPKPAAPAG